MIRGIIIIVVFLIFMFSLMNSIIESNKAMNKNKKNIQCLTEIIVDAGLWPAGMPPIEEKKK